MITREISFLKKSINCQTKNNHLEHKFFVTFVTKVGTKKKTRLQNWLLQKKFRKILDLYLLQALSCSHFQLRQNPDQDSLHYYHSSPHFQLLSELIFFVPTFKKSGEYTGAGFFLFRPILEKFTLYGQRSANLVIAKRVCLHLTKVRLCCSNNTLIFYFLTRIIYAW